MTNVQILTDGTDADAVYIKDKLAEEERAAAEERQHGTAQNEARQRKEAARLEAGLRLIEVRARVTGQKMSGNAPGWKAWLETNSIPMETAYRYMKLAGFTEEQREEHRGREAERKRQERKSKTKDIGWIEGVTQILGELPEGYSRAQISGEKASKHAEVAAEYGKPISRRYPVDSTELALIAQAITRCYVRTNPDDAKKESKLDRESLPETAKQKFDKILAKALAQQKAEEEKRYWDDVNAKAYEVMPDRIQRIEKKNKELVRDINIINNGPGACITKEEFRKLRAIHPDQQLDTEKRNELFFIIMKLEPYISAFERVKTFS